MQEFTPDRIRGLVEAAAGVAGQTDLSSLLESAVGTAIELTGARYGALGVLGEHGTLLDFIHLGMDPETVAGISHYPRGEGLLGTITTQAKTVRLEEISEHADSVGFPDNHPPMHAFLGVPVRVGDRVFGNLYLTEKEGGFTAQDELLVEFLAVTAGAAVSTLRLQERLRRAALHEDRERIARDLHDSIIQDLFAVGLSLQTAGAQVEDQPDAVRERLNDAVDRLDEAIAALRRYIFDLRPPVWARPPFEDELVRLVADLAEPYGVKVGLTVDLPPDIPEPPLTDHALAVVKESVSNALRHSEATTVDVGIAVDGKRLVVTVVDDGVGFDLRAQHGGLGLANLETRVRTAGGEYTVDSAPGRGTAITVSFSL